MAHPVQHCPGLHHPRHDGAHGEHHVGAPPIHHGAHLGESPATGDHGGPAGAVTVAVTVTTTLRAGTLARTVHTSPCGRHWGTRP